MLRAQRDRLSEQVVQLSISARERPGSGQKLRNSIGDFEGGQKLSAAEHQLSQAHCVHQEPQFDSGRRRCQFARRTERAAAASQ